ncbi:hypothetical protein EVAR_52974_1 [Eumeta japonica]|uniref:Uncharacterized protein n=1 Tax=Eumeta variegata TaxID=151549 RepID=A0A4C1Z056_EUMVA|nr:hypothetical protein EVAR_52974_1 [Eumeta japonica]
MATAPVAHLGRIAPLVMGSSSDRSSDVDFYFLLRYAASIRVRKPGWVKYVNQFVLELFRFKCSVLSWPQRTRIDTVPGHRDIDRSPLVDTRSRSLRCIAPGSSYHSEQVDCLTEFHTHDRLASPPMARVLDEKKKLKPANVATRSGDVVGRTREIRGRKCDGAQLAARSDVTRCADAGHVLLYDVWAL